MTRTFDVPDMSCGHCKMHIEKALASSGLAQGYTVDLGAKTVTVQSEAAPDAIAQVIAKAGYTPTLR